VNYSGTSNRKFLHRLLKGSDFLEKNKLGNLYFDKNSVSVGSKNENHALTIGDINPETAISRDKSSSELSAADHTLRVNINWEQLNKIQISDDIIGLKLMVWGPDSSVSGILSDFTDYDLVLQDVDPTTQVTGWGVFLSDSSLVIDRSAVNYINLA